MVSRPRNIVAPETYLALERAADFKSEYINGEIYAMAGASEAHILVSGNIFAALHSQLRRRDCRVYNNDMRVKVPNTLLYTYPDIVLICGTPRFEDEGIDTLINPTVLIEVLSASTEAYDRGEKFAHYRRLESLQEYVLASQDKMRIEQFVRQEDDSWVLRVYEQDSAEVVLFAIDCRLLVSDIYEKVFGNE